MWRVIMTGAEGRQNKAIREASDRIRVIFNIGMEYQKVVDKKMAKK
jgi:hypothetical protein